MDVSLFGAPRGSFVLLRSAQFGLEVPAAVRACRTDERGVPRLHLEFLDRQWPLEGWSEGAAPEQRPDRIHLRP
jgi:hypothetical protein